LKDNLKSIARSLTLLLLLSLIISASQGLPNVYGASFAVEGASVGADGDGGYGISTSDSQGMYNITSFLDTGIYSVTASATGFVDTTVENVSVETGSETANVDVLMPVSGGISGTITDAITSEPLQNVFVSAVYETDGVEYGSGAITDGNGNYEIITNLITASYNVTAFFASGHIMKEITGVAVTAGAMTEAVDIALERSATITGTVTDSVSMATLEGVTVYAINLDGDYVTWGTTNSSGMYFLNMDLTTGTYNITAPFPANHLSNTISGVAVTAGSHSNVDMSLSPSGAVSGQITNSANGQPIAGAYVFASSNGFNGYAITDEAGYYSITDDLGTGSYAVTAIYGMSFNEIMGISITQGSETTNVDMELTVEPSGTITGRVTDDATGDPIEFATVSAEGLNGFGSSSTDEDGYYAIDTGLGTGTYTVTATAAGFVSKELTSVNVVEDEVTANVDFELLAAPSGRISGHILTEGIAIPDFPGSLSVLVGLLAIATIAIVAGKVAIPKLKPTVSQ
jgi:hypothetical protein